MPQREAAVPFHQAGHRQLPPGRGIRLQHLRTGAGRRRRVQGRCAALRRAGGAGRLRWFLRHQESRQPHRRRFHVQVRGRHPRPRPGAARGAAPRHHGARRQPHRRIQHRRRVLARAAAVRRAGPAHPLHTVGRCALPPGAGDAPRRGQHRGVRQGALERRAQAGIDARRALLRGQLLRRHRHQPRLPRIRPPWPPG